jgi:hypothetical protein
MIWNVRCLEECGLELELEDDDRALESSETVASHALSHAFGRPKSLLWHSLVPSVAIAEFL